MFTTIALGVLSSTLAEGVTALNKRLQGTVLAGDAAFLIATGIAFLGGIAKVFWHDGNPLPAVTDFKSWQLLAPAFTEIWTISQMYFMLVTSKLNLSVQPDAPQA